MPIYEYRCRDCGERFELLRRLTDKDEEIKCPKCGQAAVQRLLSVFGTSSPDGGCAPGPVGGHT